MSNTLRTPSPLRHRLAHPATPNFTPTGKYAATEGLSIRHNKKAGPGFDVGRRLKLKKGTLLDHEITYITKMWNTGHYRIDLLAEVYLYMDPKRLRPLQGVIIPHLLAVSDLPGGKAKMEFEAFHHTGWRLADRWLKNEDKAKIMDAYGELHRHGVLHNQVSYENVLLTDTGDVRLINFGFAQALVGHPDGWFGQCTQADLEEELNEVYELLNASLGFSRGEKVVVPQKYRSPPFPSNLRRVRVTLPNGRIIWRRMLPIAHEEAGPADDAVHSQSPEDKRGHIDSDSGDDIPPPRRLQLQLPLREPLAVSPAPTIGPGPEHRGLSTESDDDANEANYLLASSSPIPYRSRAYANLNDASSPTPQRRRTQVENIVYTGSHCDLVLVDEDESISAARNRPVPKESTPDVKVEEEAPVDERIESVARPSSTAPPEAGPSRKRKYALVDSDSDSDTARDMKKRQREDNLTASWLSNRISGFLGIMGWSSGAPQIRRENSVEVEQERHSARARLEFTEEMADVQRRQAGYHAEMQERRRRSEGLPPSPQRVMDARRRQGNERFSGEQSP